VSTEQCKICACYNNVELYFSLQKVLAAIKCHRNYDNPLISTVPKIRETTNKMKLSS